MKLRIALATAALGAVALLGLTACGPADVSNSLSPEASALTALGFNTDDVTASGKLADPGPSDAPSAAPGRSGRYGRPAPLRLRRLLARHVEHGEVVVQTKQGDKTIDIQRGQVTAIDDKSITVKSADGFTQTWVFGTPLRVIQNRDTIQPSAVTVGQEVGVAGAKNGTTVTANLVVIPLKK
jgi:hypothetical protein